MTEFHSFASARAPFDQKTHGERSLVDDHGQWSPGSLIVRVGGRSLSSSRYVRPSEGRIPQLRRGFTRTLGERRAG